MMVYEDDSVQLPPALRMAASSSGRGRKFHEDDVAQQSPARHVTGYSGHGRRSIMVNEDEDEGPLLPPALRMAANSGLGKKQKKHDERMGLKNDAKAMRMRLAGMDDKAGSVSPARSRPINSRTRPTKSVSMIDTSRTRPTRSFRPPSKSRSIEISRTRSPKSSRPTKSISIDTSGGKSCGSWGKYSNELLNKKIKKVKKMISESTPGSKEYKSLNKKLTEYRAQLREQKQSVSNNASMNGSFYISEIEAKEPTEEQDDSLSEESVDDEHGAVSDNRNQEKVEEKEEKTTYSVELLKKKLSKLEKMIRKSSPGSKEYKKLQKKRTEYESQIREQDANDSITDERRRENRSQQSEQTETVRTDTKRYQSGLSWQRSVEDPEPKSSPINYRVQYGEDEKLKKQAYLEEARQLKREAMEKKRKEEESQKSATEESESESSEENEVSKHVFVEQDSQKKKQEYLEEARQLKREAMEKKRKEEELQRSVAEESESESESSEEIEVSKYVFVDQESKKQAYLEEARQLKREAMDKKQKEEELQRSAAAEESESESGSSEENEVSKYVFIDEDSKKQSYLEEARQLKREAMEKKRQEEELQRSAAEESETEGSEDQSESSEEQSDSESESSEEKEVSKYVFVDEDSKRQAYLEEARQLKREALEMKRKEEELRKKYNLKIDGDDNRRKKQTYLEEARRLKQEALKKKPNEVSDTIGQQSEDDEEERSEREEQIDVDQRNNSTSPYESAESRKELDFSAEIESQSVEKEGEKQKVTSPRSTDLTTHQKKANFLDDIKSRVGMKKEEKQRNDDTSNHETILNNEEPEREKEDSSAPFSQSPQSRKPPYFLAEIKLKACEEKEEKEEYNSTQSTDAVVQKKKSNFFNRIISKAKGGKKQKQEDNATQSTGSTTHQKNPSLLDEIKSKAKKEEHETGQGNSIKPTDPILSRKKTSFLDEIKTKAGGVKQETGQKNYTPSTIPVMRQKKPSLLDEIKSKTRGLNKETQQENFTPSTNPVTHQKKPSLLDEIKSKTRGLNKETQQENFIPSANPVTHQKKPSLLDEIKSKTRGLNKETQQENSTSSTNPVNHQKKPSLLDEIKSNGKKEDEHRNRSKPSFLQDLRSRAGGKTKDQQPGEPTPPSDVDDNNRNINSVEPRVPRTEQAHESGVENMESPKEEGTKATPNKQQQEASKEFLDRRTLPQPLSNNSKKILRELESNELRQKKLERSLIQNGINVTEEIPYEVAKDKIAEISDSMKALAEGGMDYAAEKEYFRLEEQLSKYTTALMLTDEYVEEVRRLEQEWEDSIHADNIAAIRNLRSHMPVNIRHLTEEQLVTTATPNGKSLPRPIARKFKRTNILQLLRVDPDDIEMMHPSLLEGMRTTSLTLTERRALHEHFRDVVNRWTAKKADPSIDKKWQWYQSLKLKFKETLASYSRGDKWTIKADAAVDYSEDYGYTKEATYENSGRTESKKESRTDASQSKQKMFKVAKESEADILQEYRARLRLDTDETEIDKKLLREMFHSDKRTKSLEKQLTQAGLSLPKEDIAYDAAKIRIAELTEELNKVMVNMGNTVDKKEIAKLEQTFGSLSQDLDKYNNALMLTKEWAEEQKQKERQWEIDISAANYEALQKVLRHMPVNIRNISEASLATDLTPNGKVLPKAIGRKFKRTNILMILRTDPSAIESMHPSSLEAMRTTGLTLTERRAIHEHLREVAPKWRAMTSDRMCERKWMWHASLQSKLKEMLRNPRNVSDYSDDYGYPDTPVYEEQAVAKSNLLTMEELEKRRAEEDW